MKHIKKIIAVLVVVGAFGGYIFSQKSSTDNPIVANNGGVTTSQPSETTKPNPVAIVPTPSPKPTPTPVPTPTPKPTPKPVGAFRDGTYTGSVADAYYGNIQVEAVIRNGALADVVFLQYPSDRSTSVRINTQAMPMLKSEAISAQSANVNTISGASASSGAFIQSLQSALNQAKNA
ncbi:TPA: FMN-binding protein [Candidatus Taylorbacteria bacterium]|nr:FMN-binding protein [Candidatus Taylorbacteria bacterium]